MRENRYEHQPEVVMENDKCKMYETSLYKRIMEYMGKKGVIMVKKKDKNFCQIIDFAGPYNGRVDTKE